MTRLNQELRTVADLMTRDIRRAGYWSMASSAAQPEGTLQPSATTGAITLQGSATPFEAFGTNVVGLTIVSPEGKATVTGYTSDSLVSASVTQTYSSTTPIANKSWMVENPFMSTATPTNIVTSGDDTCIQYTYDRNDDTVVDFNEWFGFRLDNGAVQMHAPTAASSTAIDCTTGAGAWETITSESVTVNTLTFDDTDTTCVNLSAGANNCRAGTTGYVAPSTGDVLLWIREIDITLSAQLSADATVNRTVAESVKIRNDHLVVN